MSLINNGGILEFNNSFSSKELDGKPFFEGGYLFGGPTGTFFKKDLEEKEEEDYYLEVKCSPKMSPTGVKILNEEQVNGSIEEEGSFSFIIKKYSAENKSSLFRGDLTILDLANDGGSFDNLLTRNPKEEYYLKVANGEIGGTKYIPSDTFGRETFYIKMSQNQGQKIFGINIVYLNGDLVSMSPSFVEEVNNDLPLRRDLDGSWNTSDSFSTFVPISIVDMDTKTTVNLFDGDIGVSDGPSQLGLNGKSGPIF